MQWDIEDYIARLPKYIVKYPDHAKEKKERVREEMIVHTQGVSPVRLIDTQRPNEPDEIKEYRLKNYEPITQQGILKAIDRLYRTLDQSNFSIKISPNIREYIQDNHFNFYDDSGPNESMSFMQLMLRHILTTMIEDPNGYLVWFPVNPDSYYEAPNIYTGSEAILVEPYYVESSKVIHSKPELFSFYSNYLHEFTYNEQKFKMPCVYVITYEQIWKLIPVEVTGKEVTRYEPELWYSLTGLDATTNYFEMMPVIELGGILTSYKKHYYFNSFLQAYNALANEAIRSFTDDQAVRVQNAFPIKAVKGDVCNDCSGSGYTWDAEHTHKSTCQTCKGTGFTTALSPYKVYIKKPGGVADDQNFASSAAVEFYSPSVDILAHTFQTWQTFLSLAEKAVNVAYIDEAQSGTAKDIDRDQLYDMQLKVSQNIFRIISKSLEIIEAYRVPTVADRQVSKVIAPTQFKTKTQIELITELTELKTKGAPSAFILETSKDLARKLYGDDSVKNKMFEIMSGYDILFPFTPAEVAQMKATNQVNNTDLTKHQYVYVKLQEIAGEDEEKFLEDDMPTIIARLDELILPLVPSSSGMLNDVLGQLG